MSNKFAYLVILLISVVFISGYIFARDNGTPNQTIGPDFIPRTNLPAGFTYMGIHETQVDIGGSSLKAVESIYRYNGDDIYVQAVKHDNPEALIAQYRLRYKDANYNPFRQIVLNGHNATQVTDYVTKMGQQEARYSVIWAKGNYMTMVGSSADAQAVQNLASTTGY